jgi:hypothetical protein
MTERDAIYVQILHHGLLRIRDSAALGHLQYCAVESEHLHNIPSLIGETNEERHIYYFCQERPHYLEHVDRSIPGLDFTLRRFTELWTSLSELNESNVPEQSGPANCPEQSSPSSMERPDAAPGSR